jgi:hypothetical protein
MDKINRLSLPATILLASIVLGGFYYMSEVNKQSSIERQQQKNMEEKQAEQQAIIDQNTKIANQKSSCVLDAQLNAINLNKDSCARGDYCIKGERMYLVSQYNNSYDTCLQGYGLK